MRYHRIARTLDCWHNQELLRRMVRPGHLAVARYEPVIRQMRPAAILDLTFWSESEVAIVPAIFVDPVMMLEPESGPIIWPASVHDSVDPADCAQIEGRILPWLRAHTVASQCSFEMIRFFDERARDEFERARASGFLGAAAIARVVRDAAPYVYAARFARDASVRIEDAAGATGSVILSRSARSVSVDLLDPDVQIAAARWFGPPIKQQAAPAGPADVFIATDARDARSPVRISLEVPIDGASSVSNIRAVPLEILFSFDQDDGQIDRRFSVSNAKERELRLPRGGHVPASVGGSHGKIVLGIAGRAAKIPDDDSEGAHELARRLRGEGFTVEIASDLSTLDISAYAIAHFFTATYCTEARDFLKAAKQAGVRTALTANLQDLPNQLWWGTSVTPSAYKLRSDEGVLQTFLEIMGRRKLAVDIHTPDEREAPSATYEPQVREALGYADVVFVSGDAEERLVREQYGYRGRVVAVAPYINTSVQPGPIDWLVGNGDFVLCVAPIESRCNQLVLARAVMQLDGVPLVIAGPVADPEYLERVREFSDERVMFVPRPSPGELGALYRRARVYADASWISTGLHNAAQAAASGCALVLPVHSYGVNLWGPGVWVCDPASEAATARAVGDAWLHAGAEPVKVWQTADRISALCDPVLSLITTVSGYTAAPAAAAPG